MFKLGDKVRYVSGKYGDLSNNPLYGGKHGNVVGEITSINDGDSQFVYNVKWTDDRYNNYCDKDLVLDIQPPLFDDDLFEV